MTTASGLRVHVAERTDVLVDALAAVLARRARRPVHAGRRRRPDARRRAVGRAAALAPAGHRRRATASAPTCSSRRRRALVARRARDGSRRRPVEPGAAALARPGDARRAPGRGLAGHGPAATWATTTDEVRRSRRFRLAHRVARLFGAVRRAAAGDAARVGGGPRRGRRSARPLPDDLRLAGRSCGVGCATAVGVPAPAERLDDVVDAAARGPVDRRPAGAACRCSARRRCPTAHLRVLDALAVHREVHLWLPQPSLALWNRLRPAGPRAVRRCDRRPRHPMLASMAGDAVELGTRVLAAAARTWRSSPPPPRPGHRARRAPATHRRRPRRTGPRRAGPTTGPSRCTHATAARARSRCSARSSSGCSPTTPTLEPRDVIVMCPDVEAFAPLVEAAFGPAAGADDDAPEHPGRTLRVRIADRAPARANPVLAVVATLLELADSRVGALGGRRPRRPGARAPAVRVRRRGARPHPHAGRSSRASAGARTCPAASATSSARCRRAPGRPRWTGSCSGSRWPRRTSGSSAPCCPSTTSARPTSTWSAGSPSSSTGSPGPWRVLAGARPAGDWFDALDACRPPAHRRARRPTAGSRRRRRAPSRRPAPRRATRCCGCPTSSRCSSRSSSGGPPGRASAPGALTVCSLAPMRAVPHRVVALLGMDDGAFPRGSGRDGDDILARDPLVGERDARQEDRQLFLDAVTSAQEHLVVVYSGADERTGAARPPAVPVGELLDALDAAVGRATPAPASCATRCRRSTSATSSRARSGRPDAFSFDVLDLAAAVAGRGTRSAAPPFVADRRSRPRRATPSTSTTSPRRSSTRSARSSGAGSARACPATSRSSTTGCRSSSAGSTGGRSATGCCRRCSPASPLADAAAAERRRGHMPPATLGGAALQAIQAQVEPLLAASQRYLVAPADERRRHGPAARRAGGHRHGERPARRRPGPHGVLAPRPEAPAAGVGAAARADGRVPGPHVHGGRPSAAA